MRNLSTFNGGSDLGILLSESVIVIPRGSGDTLTLFAVRGLVGFSLNGADFTEFSEFRESTEA